MAQNILTGNISTHIAPPLLMWWYVYNYYVYGLHPLIWRFMNLLLEVGIIYIIIRIFQEKSPTNTKALKGTEENLKEKTIGENNFKIGVSFYTLSIFPITFIILYANAIALTILLGLLGILFYLRSKKTPKNIYYSIFFLTLCALTSYIAAIWVFSVILLILFQKNFKRLIIGIAEVIGVFGFISIPLWINDPLGYLSNLFSLPSSSVSTLNETFWYFGQNFLSFLPLIIAIGIIAVYLYRSYQKTDTLDFFIITLSILLVFLPLIYPWSYILILPLISINIIHSFKKYLRINLIILGYLFCYFLLLAILFLIYPGPLNPDSLTALNQIITFGESIDVITIFHIFITPVFQIGLIYLVYSYTKSRELHFVLILPIVILFAINFLIWFGSFLY